MKNRTLKTGILLMLVFWGARINIGVPIGNHGYISVSVQPSNCYIYPQVQVPYCNYNYNAIPNYVPVVNPRFYHYYY